MSKKSLPVEVQLLVENNQGLVYHLASKIHRRLPVRQDLEDLIGYGMVGLVEAATKYKPQKGIEFSTFAWPRINGAIYDGVSKLSWMSRSRYARLSRIRSEAEASGNDEAAAAASEAMISVASLDPESANTIPEESEDESDSQMARQEEGEILGKLIDGLPNREQRLITMIYIEGLTLREASERLGISKSWASRMHSKTLTKMALSIRQSGK